MNIRRPTFEDYDEIMQLLIDMANTSDLVELHNPTYLDRYIRNVITETMKNGVFYIAQTDEEIAGFIAGMIQPQIWLPHIKILNEIAFYVRPAHRGTSVPFRLLRHYEKTAQIMLQKDIIQKFSITQSDSFGNIDYEKFGYDKLETVYVRKY